MELIKIEDLQALKEGEVYFINVDEAKRPRVLEAMNKFNSEEYADADVVTEQVDVPSCGTELCNSLVPFCLTASLPNLPGGLFTGGILFGFDSSCVNCIIEPCLLPNATVANPCPGEPPITGCEVEVNRVRAVGSIRVFFGWVFSPRCGGGNGVTTTEETVCVDNVKIGRAHV